MWAIQFLDKRKSCRERILGPVRVQSVNVKLVGCDWNDKDTSQIIVIK